MIRRRRERDDQASQDDRAQQTEDGAIGAADESVPQDGSGPVVGTPSEEDLAAGPWDAADFPGDGTGYVDLGPLRIRGRIGFQLQVPQDGGGATGSVVLVSEDSGLELRLFAAPRSGGLWDDVRAELLTEVQRLEGTAEEVDGPHGPELRVQVPVTLPTGEDGVQPSRIVGVEGPRWMLRATFLGAAALEPDEDGLLERAFREVVVVRGDEPRLVREALVIQVPEGAVLQTPTDPGTAT